MTPLFVGAAPSATVCHLPFSARDIFSRWAPSVLSILLNYILTLPLTRLCLLCAQLILPYPLNFEGAREADCICLTAGWLVTLKSARLVALCGS